VLSILSTVIEVPLNIPAAFWNVNKVSTMSYMFYNAHAFNQDISSWNISKVSTMSYMFYNAHAFNQDIDSWDALENALFALLA
jgi:surface protein